MTLKQFLAMKTMTGAELAAKAGTTPQTISNLRNGAMPRADLAIAIEKATAKMVPAESWVKGGRK